MVTFKEKYDKLYILPSKENLSAKIIIKDLNIKYNLNSVIYIYREREREREMFIHITSKGPLSNNMG